MKTAFNLVVLFSVGLILVGILYAGVGFAMKLIGSSSGITMRGPNSSDMNFTIDSQAIQTITDPGGTVNDTFKDLNRSTHTLASYFTDYQLGIDGNQNPAFLEVTYQSLNDAIATVDSNGRVSRVSNGTVGILVRATTFPWLTKRQDAVISSTAGAGIVSYPSYVSGSLGRNISDNIDNLISSVTSGNASTYLPIFSTRDDTNGIYVRNASGWAYGLDLTSISPWNSAAHQGGTLISPRHIIFAHHGTSIPVGSTIRFVTTGNVVVTRTLSSSSQVGATDIQIGMLDSDVPGTISFAKVLPSTWQNNLPGITNLSVPILCINQFKQALVHDLNSFPSGGSISYATPYESHRSALYASLIVGDSGNPAFMIINNQLVILNTWTYGGDGSGPDISANISGINSVMTSLGGGYQLTQIDLSGFPSY